MLKNGFVIHENNLSLRKYQYMQTDKYLNHTLRNIMQRSVSCSWVKSHRRLLIEIHPYGLLSYTSLLHQTTKVLRQQDIPVISTTLLRDPIDHAISLYNFLCGPESSGKRTDCHPHPKKHTKELLLAHVAHDLQCTQLQHGLHGFPHKEAYKNYSITYEACFHLLTTLFDWVGVTSRQEATIEHMADVLHVSFNRTVPLLKTEFRLKKTAVTRADVLATRSVQNLTSTLFPIDTALFEHFYDEPNTTYLGS